MRGTSHIASGSITWPAIYPLIAEYTSLDFTATGLIAGAVVSAAGALVPDIDHPNGTVAHTFGPLSRGTARVVSAISGGHRQATHSLFFVALVGVGAYFAPIEVVYALAGILSGFLVRGLGMFPAGFAQRYKVMFAALVSVAVFSALLATAPALPWFTAALTVGVLTHLLGDTLTPGGVPYLWPHPLRFRVPLLSASGDTLETVILTPVMAVGGIVWIVWLLI